MEALIRLTLLLAIGIGLADCVFVNTKASERMENVMRAPSDIIFEPSDKILPPDLPGYTSLGSSPGEKLIDFDNFGDAVNQKENTKDTSSEDLVEENISTIEGSAMCAEFPEDFVYHEESGKCYQIFTKGPCGLNQIFYKKTQESGFCDCEQMKIAPLVYHPESGNCYYVYTQAYCSPGKWLSMDPKGRPRCEINRCEAMQDVRSVNSLPTMVPLHGRGRCVQLLTPSSSCQKSQVPLFKPNHIYPSCGELMISTKSITPSHTIACPPGSAYNLLGFCSPIIEFEFD